MVRLHKLLLTPRKLRLIWNICCVLYGPGLKNVKIVAFFVYLLVSLSFCLSTLSQELLRYAKETKLLTIKVASVSFLLKFFGFWLAFDQDLDQESITSNIIYIFVEDFHVRSVASIVYMLI